MREKSILKRGRAGGGAAEGAEEEKDAEKWIDRSGFCVKTD